MKVAEGVYVITDSSGFVNAGLIEFDDGLVVVDTFHNTIEAERIKHFAADELGKPIKAVVITHEHADHTGGLSAFTAPVIASELTAQFMTKALAQKQLTNPDTYDRLPAMIFDSRLTMKSKVLTLQLVHTGGHSPGSAYLFIPELKLLFTGDTVVNGNPYMANGDFGQWLKVLNHLKSLQPEVVVVGHGQPAGVEVIDQLAGKLILFREAVREKNAQGRSADQICTEIMAEQGLEERRREMVLTTVRRLLEES